VRHIENANQLVAASRPDGFTVIELSIVLVIIGLVLGGILVGADLIRAAEIRAQVSQIGKYNAAVNTFRSKYNQLPGDMPSVVASEFGFFSETGASAGTQGHQDGNGLIESLPIGTGRGIGETIEFWRHLTDAGLIDGNYGTATAGNALVAATGAATSDLTAAAVNQIFPPAKIGRGNYITVSGDQVVQNMPAGKNYYEITGIIGMSAANGRFLAGGGDGLTLALTPLEAQQIDAKIDDGLAFSGKVQVVCAPDDLLKRSDANGDCSGFMAGMPTPCIASSQYNLSANTPACQLAIGFN